ncbi:hypothetical protein QBC33DRAFT_597313 [Phialemonium atrogriseum]|uniref:Uncharacterized protein n=1 Tax=Phialemonium atrogriseum TaxID=1093897 RepID=A0AAJ0C8U3_9PEZI|nr:uncharacterized protein QBC33DRAFT_597313 [Phialemonium atrogriseum]KAK1770842.1 hypothetical protein QBC33DRAFT_597313 [Phialemonium atrogriseum]
MLCRRPSTSSIVVAACGLVSIREAFPEPRPNLFQRDFQWLKVNGENLEVKALCIWDTAVDKKGKGPQDPKVPWPGCRVSIDISYHKEDFVETKWWKNECTSHFHVDIPQDKTKASLLETPKNFERFMYRQYDIKICKIGSDDDRANHGGR